MIHIFREVYMHGNRFKTQSPCCPTCPPFYHVTEFSCSQRVAPYTSSSFINSSSSFAPSFALPLLLQYLSTSFFVPPFGFLVAWTRLYVTTSVSPYFRPSVRPKSLIFFRCLELKGEHSFFLFIFLFRIFFLFAVFP